MGANIPGREVPDMRVTKILAVVATAAALVIAVPPVASASTHRPSVQTPRAHSLVEVQRTGSDPASHAPSATSPRNHEVAITCRMTTRIEVTR